MSSILVVDNEKNICDFLSILLEDEGYSVKTARNGIEAVKLLRLEDFDAILTDIQMPRSNGLDVLNAVTRERPNTPVIMMTAFASAETAVQAMKTGAFDYVTKPFKNEDIKLILKNAVEKKRLADENTQLKLALKDKYEFSNIIGKSAVMQKVFQYISKVATSNATVLILGESGTGKELVAKALHYNSPRRDFSFISINCGAVPEALLESELFGHEKGAFTGADSTKIGLMETSSGGTFFLDEVAEAPLSVQVKLLRVLQEMEIVRVGGTHPIKVDLRIVAATNRNLESSVKDKTFREDLYYRLKVVPIELPALRTRPEDIPFLADHFFQKFNAQHKGGAKIEGIDSEAMKILEQYSWPGNVRELENVVERAVVLETSDLITPASLPDDIKDTHSSTITSLPQIETDGPIDLENTMDEIEKSILLKALSKSDGMINKAAKMLNLSFRSMRYRVKKHQLKGKVQIDE